MIEWRRYHLDRRYFGPVGENGVVERSPTWCPIGHALGQDTVLVASHPCLCAGHPHRTWRCWACDAVWVWPPCVHHSDWVPWVR